MRAHRVHQSKIIIVSPRFVTYHKVLLVNIFHKIVVLSQINAYSSLCLLWTKFKDKEGLCMTISITFLGEDVQVNKLSSIAQHEFRWSPSVWDL